MDVISILIAATALAVSIIALVRSARRESAQDREATRLRRAAERDRAAHLRITGPYWAGVVVVLSDEEPTKAGGWAVKIENTHPTTTFLDIGLASEAPQPPYPSLGTISHLEPGQSKTIGVPEGVHLRVTYKDLDEQYWLRQFVGQDYILVRADGT